MRVFISIDFPKNIQEEVKKIQDKLPEFKGKKTEPENLHLTLKFLGEINQKQLEEIKERLKGIKFFRFETEFKNMGFFDHQKYGVVWIHLSNCDTLQKIVDSVLKDFFKSEYRFMGHLTIARVKKLENKGKFLEDLKRIEVPSLNFKVDNFKLKKSILKVEGPVYETLEEYKLE